MASSTLFHSWFATRRRRVASGLVVLIAAGIVVAMTDPFATSKPSGTGVSDNAYPTATTTVKEEDISQQSNVSATLGYAGSYTVSIPTGTAASALTEDQQSVSADEIKVASDETALANAKATAGPTNRSTLLNAQQTVTADESSLNGAKAQLVSDERLDCPASSSATVTTPVGGSSSSSSSGSSSSTNSPSSNSASPDSSSPSSSGSTSAGSTGGAHAHLAADVSSTTGSPLVTVGSASGTTSTDVTLSGTVDPNGLSTQYEFEYGTSSALGSMTASTDAGSGTSATSVSANVSGLVPDTTYDFVLVATNADGTSTSAIGSFQTAESSCVAEREVISEDEAALTEAKDTLQIDQLGENANVTSAEQALTADQATLTAAQQSLSEDQAKATNPSSTFTALPAVGTVISRGQAVYSLDGAPIPLIYGTTTLYRALFLGVSGGPDVKELEQNLVALGFERGAASDSFTAATEAAVKAWQASLGESETGVVALGDAVVEPGPIEVATVTASDGVAASGGTAVLTATSTTPVVTIALDPSLQSEVKVGDQVTITLPNNENTPGIVSSVGTIATTPSSSSNSNSNQSSSSSGSTITVLVRPTSPKATTGFDQAPVNVSITNATAANVLAVPVGALLALSSGGYALEEVGAGGAHHLVSVSLGLFDDQAGTVQVSGAGVQVGQKIVVPNT